MAHLYKKRKKTYESHLAESHPPESHPLESHPPKIMHELGRTYTFYKLDIVGNIQTEPFTLMLSDVRDSTFIFTTTSNLPQIRYDFFSQNIVQNKITKSNILFEKNVIIWQQGKEYYISPEIKFDFKDTQEDGEYYFILIKGMRYWIELTATEGSAISKINTTLTLLSVENNIYTFNYTEYGEEYKFEQDEQKNMRLLGNTEWSRVAIHNHNKCITRNVIGVATNNCLDKIANSIEEENKGLPICTQCGEEFIKDEDTQTLCSYCLCDLTRLQLQNAVIEQPGYYNIKNLPNLNPDKKPRVTIFFSVNGHGIISNLENRAKPRIYSKTCGSKYAKPFKSTDTIQLSNFESSPDIKTHLICMGNPLLHHISSDKNNGRNFNRKMKTIYLQSQNYKAYNDVNSIVNEIIEYENQLHQYDEDIIAELMTEYEPLTKKSVVENYAKEMKNESLWGIATNVGLTKIVTAEKFISGYSSQEEKLHREKIGTSLDQGVDVNRPCIRILFANAPDRNGRYVNMMIDEPYYLTNNTTMSDIKRLCETYLMDPQWKEYEKVSVIIDRTCNHATEDVFLPHIPIAVSLKGFKYDKTYKRIPGGKKKKSCKKKKKSCKK
jgi:hypothetical protein